MFGTTYSTQLLYKETENGGKELVTIWVDLLIQSLNEPFFNLANPTKTQITFKQEINTDPKLNSAKSISLFVEPELFETLDKNTLKYLQTAVKETVDWGLKTLLHKREELNGYIKSKNVDKLYEEGKVTIRNPDAGLEFRKISGTNTPQVTAQVVDYKAGNTFKTDILVKGNRKKCIEKGLFKSEFKQQNKLVLLKHLLELPPQDFYNEFYAVLEQNEQKQNSNTEVGCILEAITGASEIMGQIIQVLKETQNTLAGEMGEPI